MILIRIDDFFKEWQYESDTTLKLFSNLNNDSFNKVTHKKVRSIRNLSWHIASTPLEILTLAGLKMIGADHESIAPTNGNQLIKIYELAIEQVNLNVSVWDDSDFNEKVNMYGDEWTKGSALNVLNKHQAHHRGELIVLMQLHNLPIIGVYGPTFEDWKQISIEPLV